MGGAANLSRLPHRKWLSELQALDSFGNLHYRRLLEPSSPAIRPLRGQTCFHYRKSTDWITLAALTYFQWVLWHTATRDPRKSARASRRESCRLRLFGPVNRLRRHCLRQALHAPDSRPDLKVPGSQTLHCAFCILRRNTLLSKPQHRIRYRCAAAASGYTFSRS